MYHIRIYYTHTIYIYIYIYKERARERNMTGTERENRMGEKQGDVKRWIEEEGGKKKGYI